MVVVVKEACEGSEKLTLEARAKSLRETRP